MHEDPHALRRGGLSYFPPMLCCCRPSVYTVVMDMNMPNYEALATALVAQVDRSDICHDMFGELSFADRAFAMVDEVTEEAATLLAEVLAEHHEDDPADLPWADHILWSCEETHERGAALVSVYSKDLAQQYADLCLVLDFDDHPLLEGASDLSMDARITIVLADAYADGIRSAATRAVELVNDASDYQEFREGYLDCLLWAGQYWPENGEPRSLDTVTDASEITEEGAAQVHDECRDFYWQNLPWLIATGCEDYSRHGHDFYLTRNRHGAGFWDRGYTSEISKHLTEAAHAWGSTDDDAGLFAIDHEAV